MVKLNKEIKAKHPLCFLQIVSGYQLPKRKKDILDPYIKIDVLTTKKDYKELRSSHISNNGKENIKNQHQNRIHTKRRFS